MKFGSHSRDIGNGLCQLLRHAARIRYKRFGAALPFKARIKSVFGGKILDGLDEALSVHSVLNRMLKSAVSSPGTTLTAPTPPECLKSGRWSVRNSRYLIPLAGSEFGKKWRRFVNRVFRQMRVATCPALPRIVTFPFREPRRPFLIVSPKNLEQEGSPTMQASIVTPSFLSFCTTRLVPSCPSPSSSE